MATATIIHPDILVEDVKTIVNDHIDFGHPFPAVMFHDRTLDNLDYCGTITESTALPEVAYPIGIFTASADAMYNVGQRFKSPVQKSERSLLDLSPQDVILMLLPFDFNAKNWQNRFLKAHYEADALVNAHIAQLQSKQGACLVVCNTLEYGSALQIPPAHSLAIMLDLQNSHSSGEKQLVHFVTVMSSAVAFQTALDQYAETVLHVSAAALEIREGVEPSVICGLLAAAACLAGVDKLLVHDGGPELQDLLDDLNRKAVGGCSIQDVVAACTRQYGDLTGATIPVVQKRRSAIQVGVSPPQAVQRETLRANSMEPLADNRYEDLTRQCYLRFFTARVDDSFVSISKAEVPHVQPSDQHTLQALDIQVHSRQYAYAPIPGHWFMDQTNYLNGKLHRSSVMQEATMSLEYFELLQLASLPERVLSNRQLLSHEAFLIQGLDKYSEVRLPEGVSPVAVSPEYVFPVKQPHKERINVIVCDELEQSGLTYTVRELSALLTKLLAGFAGAVRNSDPYPVVMHTRCWGNRNRNARHNPATMFVLQCIAASLAGVTKLVYYDEEKLYDRYLEAGINFFADAVFSGWDLSTIFHKLSHNVFADCSPSECRYPQPKRAALRLIGQGVQSASVFCAPQPPAPPRTATATQPSAADVTRVDETLQQDDIHHVPNAKQDDNADGATDIGGAVDDERDASSTPRSDAASTVARDASPNHPSPAPVFASRGIPASAVPTALLLASIPAPHVLAQPVPQPAFSTTAHAVAVPTAPYGYQIPISAGPDLPSMSTTLSSRVSTPTSPTTDPKLRTGSPQRPLPTSADESSAPLPPVRAASPVLQQPSQADVTQQHSPVTVNTGARDETTRAADTEDETPGKSDQDPTPAAIPIALVDPHTKADATESSNKHEDGDGDWQHVQIVSPPIVSAAAVVVSVEDEEAALNAPLSDDETTVDEKKALVQ